MIKLARYDQTPPTNLPVMVRTALNTPDLVVTIPALPQLNNISIECISVVGKVEVLRGVWNSNSGDV